MELSMRVTDLCVAFHDRQVVTNASLDLPRAGVTVLLGRSGSGKTTFLRALNRLNECYPGCRTTGSVLLHPPRRDGTPPPGPGIPPEIPPDIPCDIMGPDAPPLPELRRRVGMVFQTPNVLPASIRRNMLLPLELVKGRPADAHDRMQAALEAVGLWQDVRQRLDQPAARLSGGQQQRLCLARMLALEPEILLLDEPTASLDAATTLDIERLVGELGRTRPVLMVSHSLGQALRLGDRIVVFADGSPLRQYLRHELSGQDCRDELLRTLL